MDIEIRTSLYLQPSWRWNSQTQGTGHIHVTEHSLLVEEIFALEPEAEPRWRLAALLHDAGM